MKGLTTKKGLEQRFVAITKSLVMGLGPLPSLLVFVAGLLVVESVFGATSEIPDFTREVRPLLSKYCFKCHGPDEATRKGGLRLDEQASATQPAKSGQRAIVANDPGSSELVRRIRSLSQDEIMPPPETKTRLTDAEMSVLEKWIKNGGRYEGHWAFKAPTLHPLPKTQNPAWTRNGIDHFVLAKLESKNMQPSAPADRYTLARRVALDLIGILPTPEEVDVLVQDTSPLAYERWVDRLLASPAYGERWAKKWMDLARYADTNGYEKDRPRTMWPWREWVIQALNRDQPFDSFTIEQIAGDMLPNSTISQRIATGFHRNTMLNEEGGIDPLEFRFHAMTDRVATTGSTWLGLTLGCAQCHTHKYDPIPHHDYYRFMAMMNQADEPDLDIPDPALVRRIESNRIRVEELLKSLPEKFPSTATATIAERRTACEKQFQSWIEKERALLVDWIVIKPTEAKSNMPRLTIEADGSVFASGDISKSDTYEIKAVLSQEEIRAIRLEVLPDSRLPRHGPGLAYYEGPKGDFFMGEFSVRVGGQQVEFQSATESYAKNNFGSSASAALAIDGDPQTGWSTAGGEGKAHEAVFVLKSALPTETPLEITLSFGRHYACSLGKFRLSVSTSNKDVKASSIPAALREKLRRVANVTSAVHDYPELFEYFLRTTPALAEFRKEIEQLSIKPAAVAAMVLQERPKDHPRVTYLHKRGEYLLASEPVSSGVLTALPSLPPGTDANRLGLARWLVMTENPLTARVTVNRHWQTFFGRGLVRTTEDFGFQGEAPTHPELLDWLAVTWMREGWSTKRLHRLIVLSATYQQSSFSSPELLEKDAENRWLARGPRFRIEAEMIRDAALRATSMLVERIGGPSVYPPQPSGVTEITFGGGAWPTSTGEARYRRSLYTFMKRTAPFAMFNTFDAPTGETCTTRREVSNTPLQALTLLNDPFYVEVTQAFGKEFAHKQGTVSERLTLAFRRFLTRPPTSKEVAALEMFYGAQRDRFSRSDTDSKAVAGDGSGDVAERATWTTIGRALLNLDEMITKG